MQYAQCINIDEPCELVGQKLALQDWDELVCKKCGKELIPVPGPKPIPLWVKVLPVALLLLGGLGFGGIKLLGSSASGGTPEVESAAGDQPGSLEAGAMLLEKRLPSGFERDGALVDEGISEDGIRRRYRVMLAPIHAFSVPGVPFQAPKEWPVLLQRLEQQVVIDSRLPAGLRLALDRAAPLDPDEHVEAIWHVHLVQGPDGWLVDGRDSLEVIASDMGAEGVRVVLSEAELQEYPAREQQMLAALRVAWNLVEQDIAMFEREAMQGVSPACTKDLKPLIREVVQLSASCPKIQSEAERSDCFLRRDRLNSEIGACETQNRLHDEGRARARQSIVTFTEKRTATFVESLRG